MKIAQVVMVAALMVGSALGDITWEENFEGATADSTTYVANDQVSLTNVRSLNGTECEVVEIATELGASYEGSLSGNALKTTSISGGYEGIQALVQDYNFSGLTAITISYDVYVPSNFSLIGTGRGVGEIGILDGSNAFYQPAGTTDFALGMAGEYNVSVTGTFDEFFGGEQGTGKLAIYTGVADAGAVIYFDNISVTAAIPEPATFQMLGLGAVCLLMVRRRRTV